MQVDTDLSNNIHKGKNATTTYTKYDRNLIDSDLAVNNENLKDLINRIAQLEHIQDMQVTIDNMYEDFVGSIVNEMEYKLNPKTIRSSSNGNKERRTSKHWWNNNLTLL